MRCPICYLPLERESLFNHRYCMIRLRNQSLDAEMLPQDWVQAPLFENQYFAEAVVGQQATLYATESEAFPALKTAWKENRETLVVWLAQERAWAIFEWDAEEESERPMSWDNFQGWQYRHADSGAEDFEDDDEDEEDAEEVLPPISEDRSLYF